METHEPEEDIMSGTARLLLLGGTIFLGSAQGAFALDADYWRGGWRTELGTEPHLYEFVIRGETVSGFYCENCADVTTIGFIDGTWNEDAGLDFTVRFPNPDGSIASTHEQQAMLADGELIVTGDGIEGERALIKDPRGADIGRSPVAMLPPGTPATPAMDPPPEQGKTAGTNALPASEGYWQPGPFDDELTTEDVVGTWVALFWGGVGMNKQLFHFMRDGEELRGVVCGRCDNPYTFGALENIVIEGDTVYFDIVHQDWGSPEATFDRQNAGRIVQNEMIVVVMDDDVDIENPPAEPPAVEGFVYTMLGPIAAERTAGNTSENVDIWGPGTGSSVEPPEGREPVQFGFP